ncbi:hypothetical protein FUA26_11410 [Seonamhaeicola algicola]|uniref:Uncharacterized protein n=2 Tax=Seonamhaeicola TaxID=1649495 RepID=A0A5C7AU97_9FLAO|nr:MULTISPECIES: hypothetical protein [Seonamhaeicola]TXE10075.1 hypothetical protein FUA26_11410 [Seonamhaeicola algicola]TYA88103.1 hypothetical protein FUA24_03900 [Seonamhaeicola marinus]
MLSDKQSILLCGFIAVVFFVAGMLDALNNFIVLTLLTLAFLAIVLNLITAKSFVKKDDEQLHKKE